VKHHAHVVERGKCARVVVTENSAPPFQAFAIVFKGLVESTHPSESTTDEVVGIAIDGQCYDFYAVTKSGDVYLSQTDGCGRGAFQFVGNVFGTIVQTEANSITDVKEKYREEE